MMKLIWAHCTQMLDLYFYFYRWAWRCESECLFLIRARCVRTPYRSTHFQTTSWTVSHHSAPCEKPAKIQLNGGMCDVSPTKRKSTQSDNLYILSFGGVTVNIISKKLLGNVNWISYQHRFSTTDVCEVLSWFELWGRCVTRVNAQLMFTILKYTIMSNLKWSTNTWDSNKQVI